MQHISAEFERTPDSPITLTQHAPGGRTPPTRRQHLRLYLYILRGVVVLALTPIVFYYGVRIIRQNARALGFFILTFNVPLPFLLIGLWSITMLILVILAITTMQKIYRLLIQLHRPSTSTQA